MPTYLQSMVQLHNSSNLLVYQVLLEFINVDLLIAPWMISTFMYLEKRDFDFPRYKKIHIIQETSYVTLLLLFSYWNSIKH